MLDNLFGQKITDKYFGKIKVIRNNDEINAFTLTKTIDFGQHKEVDLYLENQKPESTEYQFKLFNLILDNSSLILKIAAEKYFDNHKGDLFTDFTPEFLILNDIDANWELWLIRNSGFENCIIEYDNLNIRHISFQA